VSPLLALAAVINDIIWGILSQVTRLLDKTSGFAQVRNDGQLLAWYSCSTLL
jgi:hypothetical protein